MTSKKEMGPIVFHISDARTNELFSFDTTVESVQALRDFIATLAFQDFVRYGTSYLDATFPVHRIMDCLDKLLATAEFEKALEDASKKDSWGD